MSLPTPLHLWFCICARAFFFLFLSLPSPQQVRQKKTQQRRSASSYTDREPGIASDAPSLPLCACYSLRSVLSTSVCMVAAERMTLCQSLKLQWPVIRPRRRRRLLSGLLVVLSCFKMILNFIEAQKILEDLL